MKLTGLKRGFGLSLWLGMAALLAGCYYDPNPPHVFPNSAGAAPTAPAATPPTTTNGLDLVGGESMSRLRVGDPLTISFTDIPPGAMHEQKVRIPDGGIITLPYNVRVMAAGKNFSQLEKDIRDAYVPGYFVNLTAIVNTEERFFYVDGEVKSPGRQIFGGELTVLRAIGTAGGFTEFANRKKIQLRRQNGQTFYINWSKAIARADLDLPVYPNDHIIVTKTIW